MKHDWLPTYCEFGELKRQKLMERAKEDGKERAADDYPYAVYRDKATIERVAAQAFQDWFTHATEGEGFKVNKEIYLNKWRPFAAEGERLYRAAWIAGYEAIVTQKDEAARPKVQPQPTPQPTSPSNVAMLEGAILRLKRVERTADKFYYYLEVADPGYYDEAYEAPVPLVVDFSEAPVSDSTMGIASSSYGASSAIASSSAAYEAASKTPTGKKPRVYWGKR